MFTPGRYGGYIDCLAQSRHGRWVAIEWKTGRADQAAVQLAAYVRAERCFNETGATLIGGQPIATGSSQPITTADFWRCWAVMVTENTWFAYGFDPNAPGPSPALDAYSRIKETDDPAPERLDLGVWWHWQLSPDSPSN